MADAPLIFSAKAEEWMVFLLCQKLLLLVSLVARLLALFLPDVLLWGKHCLKYSAISWWLIFNKSLISFAFPTSLKDYTGKSLDGETVMFSAAILLVFLSMGLFFKWIPFHLMITFCMDSAYNSPLHFVPELSIQWWSPDISISSFILFIFQMVSSFGGIERR